MKKIVALVALLSISSLANAAFRAEAPMGAAQVIDTTPVRQDMTTTQPGAVYVDQTTVEPVAVTSPADTRYYGRNYNGPVSGVISGASDIANEAVQDVASVIPF